MTVPDGPTRAVPDSVVGLAERFPVLSPPVSTAGAAVTIVLREGELEPEVLLIVRATNSEDPASGQVALPGGRVDDGDGSLADTAVRELEEEVGLSASDFAGPLRFVGTQVAARFRVTVGVFVAVLGPVSHVAAPRSPAEVAHVLWAPRSALADVRRVERETYRGLAEVAAAVVEGHVLWGFTRHVLRRFFGLPTDDELAGPAFGEVPNQASPEDS